MATKIGRVEFTVGADGKLLERELRAIGKKAGAAGGAEAGKQFNDSFDIKMNRLGKNALDSWRARAEKAGKSSGLLFGSSFSNASVNRVKALARKSLDEITDAFTFGDGLDKWVNSFDDVSTAINKMRKNIALATREGGLHHKQAEAMNRILDEQKDRYLALERETNRVAETNKRISDSMAKLQNALSSDRSFRRYAEEIGGVDLAADRLTERVRILRSMMKSVNDEAGQTELDKMSTRLRTYRVNIDRTNASLERIRIAEEQTARVRKLNADEMARISVIMGNTSAFERHVSAVGNIDRAYQDLASRIRSVGGNGDNSAWMIRMGARLDDMADKVKRASSAMDGVGEKSSLMSRAMGTHVMRTISAWSLLIATIGEGTATLGSGLGAAITGIISSVGVALVGAIALAGTALVGLIGQIGLAVNSFRFLREEAPGVGDALDNIASASEESGRRFAAAWGPSLQNLLGKVADVIRDPAITDAFAASMSKITDSFASVIDSPSFQALLQAFRTTLPSAMAHLGGAAAQLTSGLSRVFASAAPFLDRLLGKLEEWATSWSNKMSEMAGNGELDSFFEKVLDSIDAVMGVVGALGDALWTVFQAGADSGNRMLDMITGLLDEWTAWMNTVEGQDALQTWFENGEKIFEAVLNLVGDVGSALAEMVTPESIERLLSFLDTLGEFLPTLTDIFTLIGDLDVLNLFASALMMVKAILDPLMPVLQEIAKTIGEDLKEAMPGLVDEFSKLGDKLLPLVEIFAELLAATLPSLIAIILAVISVLGELALWFQSVKSNTKEFQDAIKVMGDVVRVIFEAIANIVTTTTSIITGVLKAVASVLRGDFSQAFRDVYSTAAGILDQFNIKIQDVISWFEGLASGARNAMSGFASVVDGAVDRVAGALQSLWGPIQNVLNWLGSLMNAASSAISAVSGVGGGGKQSSKFASGGYVGKRTFAEIGEDGPEMVVPLNRPLSQVDPKARWLSAIAQGMYPTPTDGGGGGDLSVGGGKQVVFAEGAIVVQEASDGVWTANAVVNRMIERASEALGG